MQEIDNNLNGVPEILFRYNSKSKWKRGKVSGMRMSKTGLRFKVYQFVNDTKVLDWDNTVKGLPGYKRCSGWFFFCWLPGKNISPKKS